METTGYLPLPRAYHAAAVIADVMYIFGGRSEAGDDLSNLAALNLITCRWYTFPNMGPAPSARFNHSLCVYKHLLFVLGGKSSNYLQNKGFVSCIYIGHFEDQIS